MQKQEYPFELISEVNGLSQSMVNCITQDHYGFMWFGTKDGLNRYDGRQFVVYKSNSADSNSLRDNYITKVFEDSKNRMWIGTSREGVQLFDRDKEIFYQIPLGIAATPLSPSPSIVEIQEDKDHNLWVGTVDGLYKISFKNQQPKHKTFFPAYSLKKYFKNECNLTITQNGEIYGTAVELFPFYIRPDKSGNDHVGQLPQLEYDRMFPKVTPPPKYFCALAKDTLREKIYFLYDYCFIELDLNTKASKIIYRRTHGSPKRVFKAIVDDHGIIWVCAAGGIEMFNPVTGEMKIIAAENKNIQDAVNSPNSIFFCRSGIRWIGTSGFGILKYNPSSQKFNKVKGGSFSWMSPVKNGKITAIFGDNDLRFFDTENASFNKILNGNSYDLKFMKSNASAQIVDGILWICGNHLLSYDSRSQKKVIIETNGTINLQIFFVKNGDVWYGSKDAFSHYISSENRYEEWKYPFPVSHEAYGFIQAFHQDGQGNFWLGTNNGLLFLNPVTHAWKRYEKENGNPRSLSNNTIFSILADPVSANKILWIGTNGGGLNRMDISTGSFTHFTDNDGLPNNVVYGILSDGAKNLWLSTNRGLSRFDPASKKFRNFDVQDGLQANEFNRNAFCKDFSGRMYFGGINGLNHFRPEDIRDNAVKPLMVITAIKIKNEYISFKKTGEVISKPAYLAKEVHLDHADNMITFEFAALEFSTPSKNQYQYKLEGFDKVWIDAGNNNSAIYTNLDPGTYVFHVRGSNNDGIWSEHDATIRLFILPPWYMTWWFRTALVLLISASIYALYRYRLQQATGLLQLRNRIAGDLHDEIGSTLSSISLYGEVAKKMVQDDSEAKGLITKINDSTTGMMEAISDIVWTINTRNDTMDEVISKIRIYAAQRMEALGCELHFIDLPRANRFTPDMIQRKNIYLLAKEAINNAAKYSGCKNLYVEFNKHKHEIFLTIRDDGKGYDTDLAKKGNGLYNMQQRAKDIKGALSIKSTPGTGTEVILTIPF